MDAFTIVAKLILNKSEFDSSLGAVKSGLESKENQSVFSGWGAKMGRLAGQAMQKAISGAIKFGISALETGMEFDETMSYVQAIGQMEADKLEQVRNKALELGASTKFTAKETAEAFGYMALAGWDADEMLKGIDGVLSLAAASGEDLGRVSDIVTDALTAFGLEAEDSGHFVDVLAQASANSNTTVAQMGEAFKYLATTGGVLGYTIDDVAVALGLMANNGIKGSQAGTSMRQVLNTLIKPTEDAAKAMDALGLSLFEDNSDKRKPLMQVMTEMREAFSSSGFNLEGQDAEEALERWSEFYTEWFAKKSQLDRDLDEGLITKSQWSKLEKAYAEEYEEGYMAILKPNEKFLQSVASIGGARGIGSLLAIMKATEGDFSQLAEAVENSDDAAQTMAETMIDNLKGDITILNSALDGLKILISDEFKGNFRTFVQSVTEGVGDLSEAFQESGIAGMLTGLTDWIINGMTTALTDKSVTEEGAREFGKAVGDFVGHLVSTLVTAAPEIMGGLFEAGMNLAGGLVEGMFAGLFGTGTGTVYGLISSVQGEEQDAINDAEQAAIKATGIVNYMDTLVAKYGDAAKNTSAWTKSLELLEQIMPGITESIKKQSETAGGAAEAIRKYIEGNKELAIEEAKRKSLEKYQTAYEGKQAEMASAELDAEMARYQAEAAREKLIGYAVEQQMRSTGENELSPEEQQKIREERIEGWRKSFGENEALAEQRLSNIIATAMLGDESGIIKSTYETYEAQKKAIKDNEDKVNKLSTEVDRVRTEFELAEIAFNNLSNRANAALIGGMEGEGTDGEHASGLHYVPYDGYIAKLHRGERVLTADQARKADRGGNTGIDEAIAGMLATMKHLRIQVGEKEFGSTVVDYGSNGMRQSIAGFNRRKRMGYGSL